MHGVKRPDRPKTQEEIDQEREKIAAYQEILKVGMNMKRNKVYDDKSLLITGKILTINPEFYSLWNFRRDILSSLYLNDGESDSESKIENEETKTQMRESELKLTFEAISRNPKSYGSWFHRQWVLVQFLNVGSGESMEVVEKELNLCDQFLTRDQRNFHCWNYRRHLISHFYTNHLSNTGNNDDLVLKREVEEKEMKFGLKKVEENFSNYSAFHHRSVYLLQIYQNNDTNNDENSTNSNNSKCCELTTSSTLFQEEEVSIDKETNNNEELVDEDENENENEIGSWCEFQERIQVDLDLITNAIYTEPEDQSAW